MCDYHKNQPKIKDMKTPMPNNMGKDKLLLELAYLDQAEYIDKQAYAQLVEIVEQHFSKPDPDTEGVEEFEDMIAQLGYKKEHYVVLIDRIKQLLQQKPQKQVTRGELSSVLIDVIHEYNSGDYPKAVNSGIQWLKERGIEVEE